MGVGAKACACVSHIVDCHVLGTLMAVAGLASAQWMLEVRAPPGG